MVMFCELECDRLRPSIIWDTKLVWAPLVRQRWRLLNLLQRWVMCCLTYRRKWKRKSSTRCFCGTMHSHNLSKEEGSAASNLTWLPWRIGNSSCSRPHWSTTAPENKRHIPYRQEPGVSRWKRDVVRYVQEVSFIPTTSVTIVLLRQKRIFACCCTLDVQHVNPRCHWVSLLVIAWSLRTPY